jgi:hypothetical protein
VWHIRSFAASGGLRYGPLLLFCDGGLFLLFLAAPRNRLCGWQAFRVVSCFIFLSLSSPGICSTRWRPSSTPLLIRMYEPITSSTGSLMSLFALIYIIFEQVINAVDGFGAGSESPWEVLTGGQDGMATCHSGPLTSFPGEVQLWDVRATTSRPVVRAKHRQGAACWALAPLRKQCGWDSLAGSLAVLAA